MTDAAPTLLDTRDMNCVHDVFRRALGEAPTQIAAVPEDDQAGATAVASYLDEVLWLLHAHHDSEDELLYPLLVERVPAHAELFSRMASQHQAVTAGVDAARQASARFAATFSASDGLALATACRSLLDQVAGHLTDEEVEVLPVAARTITPEEWGALPGHALSQYAGTRLWLILGLVFEAMPDDLRTHVLTHLPPPVSDMWFGFGADAFAKEMAAIRGEA